MRSFLDSFPRSSVGMQLWLVAAPAAEISRSARDKLAPTLERGSQRGSQRLIRGDTSLPWRFSGRIVSFSRRYRT